MGPIELADLSLVRLVSEGPRAAGTEAVQKLLERATHRCKAYSSLARAESSEIISEWAQGALDKQGAKGAFAWIKSPGLMLEDCFEHQGQAFFEPLEVASARAHKWGLQWEAKEAFPVGEARRAFNQLRETATSDLAVLEPLTIREIQGALLSIRRGTAKGVDQTAPDELRDMPAEGWAQLQQLLSTVERRLAVPAQHLLSLMAILPKPAGGERTVVLLSMLMRTWGRARRGEVRAWDRDHARFWDSAIQGNSALKAALLRRALDESAHALGVASLTLLADIEKFYDSLCPVKVIEQLLAQDYPSYILAITMQMHWAPRVLTTRACTSEVVQVGRSVLAGCFSSTSVARGYVLPIVERMHFDLPYKAHTRLRLGVHVDDISIRKEGHSHLIVIEMADATTELFQLLEAAGLKVAGKSVLVSTRFQIASLAKAELESRGITVQASKFGRDLGVDTGSLQSRGNPEPTDSQGSSQEWQTRSP